MTHKGEGHTELPVNVPVNTPVESPEMVGNESGGEFQQTHTGSSKESKS
jgi:hypothetical protein